MVQEDRNRTTANIFGDGNASLAPASRPVPPPAVTESKEDFLSKEKEMVGIYLSAHPLDIYRFEINRFSTHTIRQALDLFEASKPKEVLQPITVTLAGLVTATTSAIAKSGRKWGSMTVEDYTAAHKFTLFGTDYEKAMPYLNNGEAVLLTCIIQERPLFGKDREKVQKQSGPREKEMRLTNIALLSNAKDKLRFLTLTLSVEDITDEFRQELLTVLRENPGKISPKFHLRDVTHKLAVTMLSRNTRIDITPALLDWLSKKNIPYTTE